MTKSAYPTENEIHAFIDDELSASRRAEIACILRQDPALAMRVAAYQADSELLRTAIGSIDDQPLPATWATKIEAATASRRQPITTRRFAIAAGVALAASVVVVASWRWRHADTILAEAEAARNGRLVGRLAGGEPLPPQASRDALLQSALGLHVRAPDLKRFGFQLVRMELFGRPGGGAVQLRYADADQRTLTIFVRPSDGTVRFDILREGQTRVCVWQDDVVGTVIIAPVSAAEMLRIASSAYTDLNL